MKATSLACLVLTLSLSSILQAEEPDITKRAITDPLLKISTATALLPEKDDKWLEAKRDEKHIPPLYRHIWTKQDVIMLEPFSREKPAEIDFSAITKNNKGVLRIAARNHPGGDFMLEIVKNGQSFKKEAVGSNKWEKFVVPFDHEDVVLKDIANGWHFEFAFIDYTIGKAD